LPENFPGAGKESFQNQNFRGGLCRFFSESGTPFASEGFYGAER
jgi:hypothetical protein